MIAITEEMIQKSKQEREEFEKQLEQLKVELETTEGQEKFEKSLKKLLEKYKKNYAVFLEAFWYGEELMDQGKIQLGYRCLQIAKEVSCEYVHDVTYYLRSAQYYIEIGDVETGTSYLIKLCCETVSNYEESIGFGKLRLVWEKYKHLVEGKVPASTWLGQKRTPLRPEECTMQIADILQLPEDSLLSDLSNHLYELSGGGDFLNYLNRWEKLMFYLDTLCTDINSDGVEFYTDYHWKHWKQTRKAFEELEMENGVLLIDKVREKKKKRVEDFEEEEEFYYKYVEKELLEKLYQYVLDNKTRFR